MEKVGLQAVFDTADFQRGIQIYNSGIVQINNSTKAAARQSQVASQTMSAGWQASFGKIIAGVAAAVAAFKGLEASTKMLQEAATFAARVEMLGIALETVGENAGYSQQQIAEYTKAVEAQGITTQASRQALLMMGAAEIDFAHSTDLARIAQDAARIANVNSSEAFQQMIYGIETGQVRVLRTMGIMVNFENVYKKVAATLGKTTEEMTEQEKVEARVQAVMEFGTNIAGTYEASLGTAGGTALSLARHLEQLQLALGNVMLDGFAAGIGEVTRLLKDLREWVADNENELAALRDSFGGLVEALIRLADLEIDTEGMDSFVESLTALLDAFTILIDDLAQARDGFDQFAQAVGLAQVGVGGFGDMLMLAINPAEFARRKLSDLIGEAERGTSLADQWRRQAGATRERPYEQETRYLGAYRPPGYELPPTEKEVIPPPDYTKAAEAVSGGLDKIRGLQKDYYRDLAKMEADYNDDRAKEEQKYLKAVEKERANQAKQFEKLTAAYEKKRAETIADFQKQIAKAEASADKDRLKAAADFARQEKQERERYQLDRIQNERRYQFEKAQLIAEGDTLAIEELNARYKLEKQEAAENEALRQRQEKENQAAEIEEAGAAAREQLDEMKAQLDEQLAEQDTAYQEQIADQQAANAERLADMAEAHQEQTAAREEQYADQKARRDEDYRRQLEELGQSMADQKELQEYGASNVATILQQYYGEGGVADIIMQGWHEREAERIVLTSEMLAGMAATAAAYEESAAYRAAQVGGGLPMDVGGIVQGPATVRVGAGIVEAFTPLGRAGGNLSVSWAGGPIPITGLERGSPGDVNAIGRALAESLTEKVRIYRRS